MAFGGAERCTGCEQRVYATEKVVVDEGSKRLPYHKTCLKCTVCTSPLTLGNYTSHESKLYCNAHWKEHGNHAMQRSASKTFQAGSRSTENAGAAAGASPARRFGANNPKCGSCGKTVYATEKIIVDLAGGPQSWHKTCLRCKHCQKVVSLGDYIAHDGEVFCKPHFKELTATGLKFTGNVDTKALLAKRQQEAAALAKLTSLTPVTTQDDDSETEHTVMPSSAFRNDSSSSEDEDAVVNTDETIGAPVAPIDDDPAEDEKETVSLNIAEQSQSSSPSVHNTPGEEASFKPESPSNSSDEDSLSLKNDAAHLAAIKAADSASLKSAVTKDASAPKLPKATKTSDTRHVIGEIAASAGKTKLKHVAEEEKQDKSAPNTEGAQVKADAHYKRGALLDEVESKSSESLRHVDDTERRDASAPLTEGAQVKADAHFKRGALLNELEDKASNKEASLKATETKDASAPKLPKAAKVQDVQAVVAEVAASGIEKKDSLRKVSPEEQRDASVPHTEGATVKADAHFKHGSLLNQIEEKSTEKLRHVDTEERRDASAPKLEAVSLVPAPRKQLNDELLANTAVGQQADQGAIADTTVVSEGGIKPKKSKKSKKPKKGGDSKTHDSKNKEPSREEPSPTSNVDAVEKSTKSERSDKRATKESKKSRSKGAPVGDSADHSSISAADSTSQLSDKVSTNATKQSAAKSGKSSRSKTSDKTTEKEVDGAASKHAAKSGKSSRSKTSDKTTETDVDGAVSKHGTASTKKPDDSDAAGSSSKKTTKSKEKSSGKSEHHESKPRDKSRRTSRHSKK